MKELKFKSNINCTGCLSKVKPVLDSEEKIETWEVDLQSDDRVLTVKTKDMKVDEVKQRLAQIGFDAEAIPD